VASVELQRELSGEKLCAAINGNIAPDARVIDAQVVDADFHARYSARGKTYRYRIFNARYASPFLARYTHTDARPLDLERMQACARLFPGTHDWTAFSAAQTDVQTRVRTVTQLEVGELPALHGALHRGHAARSRARADGRVASRTRHRKRRTRSRRRNRTRERLDALESAL
jgi:tRNA pseudouridine38-40 synthase